MDDLERTRREIRAASIIKSDNVPEIYESNIDEDNPRYYWLIEQYVECENLRHFLENRYEFQTSQLLIFLETFLKLSIEIENNKLVHRDIKPENILFDDKNNKFWLLDFGLARHLDLTSLTPTNIPYGLCTWGYAASEQFRNLKKQINIRADLFSIGVVAFEMINGYNPFIKGVNNILQVIKNIENLPIPNFMIKGDTQYLLAMFIKNLADNRLSRRPRTAKEAYEIFKSIKDSITLT